MKSWNPIAKSIPPQTGMLRVVSAPEGAEVSDAAGRVVGTTNTGLIPVNVGDVYFFRLKKSGYRSSKLEGIVPPTVATEPLVLPAVLEVFSPPQTGEKWDDHLGNSYQPAADEHISSGFMTKAVWERFTTTAKRPANNVEFLKFSQNGQPVTVALASAQEAQAFCSWFRESGYKAGFLTEDHEVVPVIENSFENPNLSQRARSEGLKPFRLQVRQVAYGQITFTTQPPGVEVYMNPLSDPTNRISKGSAVEPLVITKVKPGVWQFYLVREGYKPLSLDITVSEGETVAQEVTLEKSLGVVFGKAWENGIGMRFSPLGQDLMVSIWETRLLDYQRFVRESRRAPARVPDFSQTPDHPVVNVSREDAQAFCGWLTERERKDERIARTHGYRLPTDLEWSMMVGLQEEEGISPGWRDARKQAVYPWGVAWPPAATAGNFADLTAAGTPGISIDRTIPNYNDGFANTAPVGSFPANSPGLHDLSGNVQEWVEDEYSKLGKNLLGVLRGGGWNTFQSENLLAGSRNAVPPTFQDAIYGFRVVLAKPKSE